jgi:hypothetical protein
MSSRTEAEIRGLLAALPLSEYVAASIERDQARLRRHVAGLRRQAKRAGEPVPELVAEIEALLRD